MTGATARWRPLTGRPARHLVRPAAGDPASPVYNTAEYVVPTGAVDTASLDRAIWVVLAECEAVRLRFTGIDDDPIQRVAPELPGTGPVVEHVDLSDLPDPRRSARHWMDDHLDRLVDLATEPLVAEAIITVGPLETWWFQRTYHIALDGYGYGLLAGRVAQLYTAAVTGRPAARARARRAGRRRRRGRRLPARRAAWGGPRVLGRGRDHGARVGLSHVGVDPVTGPASEHACGRQAAGASDAHSAVTEQAVCGGLGGGVTPGHRATHKPRPPPIHIRRAPQVLHQPAGTSGHASGDVG